MKRAILCSLFLIVGVIIGAAATHYLWNRYHQHYSAFIYASDLGSDAMLAEMMKQGETAYVLSTIENRIPERVIEINGNETIRSIMTADTAMFAVKRFYVCTKTPIPANISSILDKVALPQDACPAPN